jgi:hypothetical protein
VRRPVRTSKDLSTRGAGQAVPWSTRITVGIAHQCRGVRSESEPAAGMPRSAVPEGLRPKSAADDCFVPVA